MDAIVYDKVGKEAEKVRDALYGIYPQETITDSAIASFDDGADGIPVKALTVGIEPVQDLHGYDAPWPAGGGKNKLDYDTVYATYKVADNDFQGNSISVANVKISVPSNLVGQQLTWSAYIDLTGKERPTAYFAVANVNGTEIFGSRVDAGSSGYSSVTFTPTSTSDQFAFSWGSGDDTIKLKDFQLEIGSSRTTWTPYANICPISGHTGAEISNAAANIWDEDWANGYYNTSGNFVSSNNYVCSKNKIMVEPDTLYYLHFPVAMTIRAYDSNQQFIGTVPGTWRNETFKPAGYFSGVRYITFNSAASGALTTYNHDISINYPATDTEYHPYTGNQISVTFPSEAGTVYSGTITLNPDRTGTLVADRASVNAIFTEIYNNPSNPDISFAVFTVPYSWSVKASDWEKSIFESGKRSATGFLTRTYGDFTVYDTSSRRIAVCCPRDITVAEAQAFFMANKFVYKLAEPQSYQLTAEQVSGILETLYGTNNIWADTGNIEKLTYHADLGKYIDSHITTAVANALNA